LGAFFFGGGLTDLPRSVDVLIAGAGPAGSATAALLARTGLSVLAVDRCRFPRDKPCAEYMSPETVRMLDRLGVLGALERAGAFPLEGLKVTAQNGASACGKFALAGHRPYRSTGLSVSRRLLDAQLVDAARDAGARVQEQSRVEELLYQDGGVAGAVVRDPAGERHAVRARLTVGADGLRSIVARRIGNRTHGLPRRWGFVAHVAGVDDMTGVAELHFGSAGYVGLNPIGGGLTNVGLVVPADRAALARGDVESFFLRELEAFPEVRARIPRQSVTRRVLATGPFSAWSRRLTAPGALLVGDAADFFDPFTGDGIYSALRGAELILETVAPALQRGGPLTDADLMMYRRMRRRVFTGKWIMERLIGYAMHFPRLFQRSVDRLGRHEPMAHTMVGVAGGFVPAREALNPRFLTRMLL
jgi:menaquinone-9 beta-reductase